MKWLEMVNVFGIPFSFTVFNQKKYKTILGLFFSLLSIVLVIVFAFLFGEDFFFRLNPRALSSQIIPTEYTYTKMTSDMLVLPWRISNSALEKVDFSGLVYPIIYYHRYFKDPVTYEVLDHQVSVLSYKACKPNANFTSIEIENYFCFDLDGLVMGGNWEGVEYSYITLTLTFCPGGNPFVSDDNCMKEDVDKLNEILNGDNPWIFVFVYPEHNFQPKSIESPIKQNYRIYTYVLNLQLMREDFYTFQRVQMVDDQGLIFPLKKETSMISLYEKDSVFYYFNYNSLFEGTASSVFYIMNISLGKNYEEYSRSYMKFQEVIANIGGFIRVIVILFDVCSGSINEMFLTASLIAQFFELEKSRLHSRSNPLLNISRFGLNISGGGNNMPNCSVDKTIMLFNSTKPFPDPSDNVLKFGSNKGDTDIIKLVKAKRAKDKGSISFPLCNLFKFFWFPCCINGFTTKEKAEGFSIALKALRTRTEIVKHIQMANEFQVLKGLLLNKFQSLSLRYMKKANAFGLNAMSSIYHDMKPIEEEAKDLRNLPAYYTEAKMHMAPLEKDYDMTLYQYLDPVIQKILN